MVILKWISPFNVTTIYTSVPFVCAWVKKFICIASVNNFVFVHLLVKSERLFLTWHPCYGILLVSWQSKLRMSSIILQVLLFLIILCIVPFLPCRNNCSFAARNSKYLSCDQPSKSYSKLEICVTVVELHFLSETLMLVYSIHTTKT